MYPFHSSVTSQTHMPQLHPPHPASLPPNHVKNNRSRNSLLRHDTGEEKKKESLLYKCFTLQVFEKVFYFTCNEPKIYESLTI